MGEYLPDVGKEEYLIIKRKEQQRKRNNKEKDIYYRLPQMMKNF